jgi:DNA anti-recombination protein RmuC
MSGQGSSGAEQSVLAESLQRETDAIKMALRRGRAVRIALVLMLVLLIVVIAQTLANIVNRLQSEQTRERLLAEVQNRSDRTLQALTRELQTLLENVREPVVNAFLEQAKENSDEFLQRVNEERDRMAEELRNKLEQRLRAHHEKLLAEMRALLREEFPKMDENDYDRMVRNFQGAADTLARKHYVDELKNELERMYKLWDAIPPADPPREGDQPLEDQLVGHLVELLRLKIVGADQTRPAS